MQTKSYLTRLLVALMTLLPLAVSADETVQLAKWTFDTGYTVADNVYTPNSDDWAAIGWNGFGTLPAILPNEYEGTQTDYYVSAKGTRFWGIQDNNGDRILSLYQDMDPNNISDYTDATQHNQYFEIGFPTKGYKNVHFTFSFTCGDNKERALEAVVSTDGGRTWSDAGAYSGAANWWIYKTNDVTLSANDKDQVIVRLIAPNDETAQWRVNDISITAEKAEGPVAVSKTGFTATWELKSATMETNAATSAEGLFSVANLSLGDKITAAGLRTDGTVIRQQFQPTEQAAAGDDNATIVFTLKPKKTLTFTPKSLSFNASRVGTNGGAFDVVVTSNGESKKIASGVTPQLAKEDPYISNHTFDLSDIPATDDIFTVKIYIYNLANNKQYAFSDVVISGDVEGTIEPTPVYTLSVGSNMTGAGKVSTNPAGAEFDEGTIITASATENFGYHFQSWTDETGEVVSTSKNYTFEIAANTTLTAQYTKANVYALNLTRTEGVAENLVQYQPEGNYVDGIHYYEEGTDVVLTAVNNRIMTFTGWDGDATGTAQKCEVKMTGERNVTANFSAVDYIVGWDLYYDQPAKDRAADYKADSENAGMLSLRKADGTTNGWLTRGSSNGQENGKYAARIWKFLSEEWYYEISFSSKGYENLVISSCIGSDYNTYSENNVEYSIDGTNFTKIGTFDVPARAWDGPKEFALPEAANDQDRVWIRWMPNRESDLVGVSSDYDGTSIAEIFVLADQKEGASQMPTLVSSTPADGATDASANGSVILNFDAKVKAGTGVATLDGEEITPIISGKSAVFKYSGLKYNTQYTFTMPKGVLTSRSGNDVDEVVITFTTMERTQPEKRVYDAIVAQDGTGDYTTVQAAIDAAPEGRGKPWLIFIKNGQYKEHVDVPATKPYLHFIGQSRDGVVIKDDRLSGGDNAVHVSIGATVVVNADNTFFESLTMENIYGHEKQNGPQALALNTVGDRICLNNVALLSYQDTWITTSTQKNRHYIKNSLIEGAVDFIYNGGDVYLDGDTLEINRPSGGYIVAPNHTADTKWGYVFKNNVLRAHPGVNVTDIWLGRPWHNQPKTVFINLQTFINIPAKGWYETMGGLPSLWADYNTVDANGNPVDLSQREDTYYYTQYYKMVDGEKVIATSRPEASDMPNWTEEKVYGTAKNYLTDEEAAQYTIKNVMGGDDNWQPDLLCEATEAPAPVFNDNTISWDEVPYAICYVVTRGDEVVAITTETSVDVNAVVCAKGSAALGANDSEEPYKVQSVNEQGGLSKFGIATDATALNAVSAAKSAKSNVYYNIAGQRVNSSFKGMVISDGKKYMK
ncbi:MAG: pectinesterase family protein [Prevotella sp.]|nr:pectinesterase family protein [Prevotella sp.]